MDGRGLPVKVKITSGTVNDCVEANNLINGITAEILIADKGYDSNKIIEFAKSLGMQVHIPPKSNRKFQREYDKLLYKLRHFVENTFMHLKRWRGIATRYFKTTLCFENAVNISCLFLWLPSLLYESHVHTI